jgi:hypothetical protein
LLGPRASLAAASNDDALQDTAGPRDGHLTVATRNIADFRQFDVPLINPFEFR